MCEFGDSLTEIDWLHSLCIKPSVENVSNELKKVKEKDQNDSEINPNQNYYKFASACDVSTRETYSNNSDGNNTSCGNKKPSYSYAYLIKLAIENSKERRMKLNEIYKWITDNFVYYRNLKSDNNRGWKNAIRHNLSLNKLFIRCPKNPTQLGKGSYWTIDPYCDDKVVQCPPVKKLKVSCHMTPTNPMTTVITDSKSNSTTCNVTVSDNVPIDLTLLRSHNIAILYSSSTGTDDKSKNIIIHSNSNINKQNNQAEFESLNTLSIVNSKINSPTDTSHKSGNENAIVQNQNIFKSYIPCAQYSSRDKIVSSSQNKNSVSVQASASSSSPQCQLITTTSTTVSNNESSAAPSPCLTNNSVCEYSYRAVHQKAQNLKTKLPQSSTKQRAVHQKAQNLKTKLHQSSTIQLEVDESLSNGGLGGDNFLLLKTPVLSQVTSEHNPEECLNFTSFNGNNCDISNKDGSRHYTSQQLDQTAQNEIRDNFLDCNGRIDLTAPESMLDTFNLFDSTVSLNQSLFDCDSLLKLSFLSGVQKDSASDNSEQSSSNSVDSSHSPNNTSAKDSLFNDSLKTVTFNANSNSFVRHKGSVIKANLDLSKSTKEFLLNFSSAKDILFNESQNPSKLKSKNYFVDNSDNVIADKDNHNTPLADVNRFDTVDECLVESGNNFSIDPSNKDALDFIKMKTHLMQYRVSKANSTKALSTNASTSSTDESSHTIQEKVTISGSTENSSTEYKLNATDLLISEIPLVQRKHSRLENKQQKQKQKKLLNVDNDITDEFNWESII